MKRTIESIEAEEDNVQALCVACRTKTLQDVVAAFKKIGTPNVVGKYDCRRHRCTHLRTPLMFACYNRNWDEAKSIVSFLLERGATTNGATDDKGSSVLHCATSHSNFEVVRLLVINGQHAIDPVDTEGRTPLRCAVLRKEQAEAVKIARFLVDQGSDLCLIFNGYTMLGMACSAGVSMEMVAALSPKDHPCINQVYDDEGETALLAAAGNPYHGTQSFPHLIAMGADPSVVSKQGTNVLMVAYQQNASLLKCVGLYANADQIERLRICWLPRSDCPDTLGVLRAAQDIHGTKQRKQWFRFCFETKKSAQQIWAFLRIMTPCFDDSKDDYYRVLRERGAPPIVWSEVALQAAAGIHPISGDSLLHNAIRSNDLATVKYLLTKRRICPFFRNAKNETPMHVALELRLSPEWIQTLNDYSAWKPTLMHMEWYGPFFRMRARTFLLVCKRLRVFPKDVIFLILERVASIEEV
jgi:ankyrin repeat protein